MEARNVPTYDDALRLLLRDAGMNFDQVRAAGQAKSVVTDRSDSSSHHQPLSFKYLSSCEESMTYFTELCPSALSWLVEPLERKVQLFGFFHFFLFLCF
jgi:hypothetical protein